MAGRPRYTEDSEYGGAQQVFQPADKHDLTAQERAMLVRSAGKRKAGQDADLPIDDRHKGAVDEVYRDFDERWGGRSEDEAL